MNFVTGDVKLGSYPWLIRLYYLAYQEDICVMFKSKFFAKNKRLLHALVTKWVIKMKTVHKVIIFELCNSLKT